MSTEYSVGDRVRFHEPRMDQWRPVHKVIAVGVDSGGTEHYTIERITTSGDVGDIDIVRGINVEPVPDGWEFKVEPIPYEEDVFAVVLYFNGSRRRRIGAWKTRDAAVSVAAAFSFAAGQQTL